MVGSATAIKCICAYLIRENTLTIDKGIYHVGEPQNLRFDIFNLKILVQNEISKEIFRISKIEHIDEPFSLLTNYHVKLVP